MAVAEDRQGRTGVTLRNNNHKGFNVHAACARCGKRTKALRGQIGRNRKESLHV